MTTADETLRMFVSPEGTMLARLNKALYGLKRAGLLWYNKFSSLLHEFGLTTSRYDRCLFLKGMGETLHAICLIVDDMFSVGPAHQGIG